MIPAQNQGDLIGCGKQHRLDLLDVVPMPLLNFLLIFPPNHPTLEHQVEGEEAVIPRDFLKSTYHAALVKFE
jgi:hypothetical protein